MIEMEGACQHCDEPAQQVSEPYTCIKCGLFLCRACSWKKLLWATGFGRDRVMLCRKEFAFECAVRAMAKREHLWLT